MKCKDCERTIEQILEQDGEIEISSNEEFVCKHCKSIEEHKQWLKYIKKMFDVDKLEQENKILKDNYNKLKEFVEHEQICVDDGFQEVFNAYGKVLDKMKELEKVNI